MSQQQGARFADGSSNEKGELDKQITTTDNDSSRYATSSAGLEHKHQNKVAERKLLLKLDAILLPLCMLLYLSAYLDRGNMGNAKLQGLESTILGGDETRYSIALALFFVTYVIFNIPGTLLAKAIYPSRSIALGAFIWSVAATCQAATSNPAGLYVCRLFIGIGEAGFGQAVPFCDFAYFYRKNELAKRVGLYITCGALAGAFGGLISYGVAHINSSIAQWRLLFLIEGLPGVLIAICAFVFLPARPEKTRYFSSDERTLALTRLNADSLGNEGNAIDWRAVIHAFKEPRMYIAAVMYSCMNLNLGSVGGFLPTIIKNLGYSNADAQLFTVPPYAVTVVFMLIMTSLSDRYKMRGLFAAFVFLFGILGWGILLGVDAVNGNMHVRYFGCFCIVMAGYADIPIIISWMSNNAATESQRAVYLGMLNTVGQCLSILAAFLFPSSEAPRFYKGGYINLAFQILGMFIALGLHFNYRYINAKRDREEGKPVVGERIDTSVLYDKAPGFRYVL